MTSKTKPTLGEQLQKLISFILKTILHTFFILVGTVLVYLNLRLYYSPTYVSTENTEINQGVLHQLRYLKTMVHSGGGKTAQGKYPEGFVFMNALYGLTWTDFVKDLSASNPLRKEGLEEIDWVLEELEGKYAQGSFPLDLSPQRGVFYVGWKNYLLGKRLLLQPPSKRSAKQSKQFKEQCDSIYAAYQATDKTYLESYKKLAWPADNVVAVASLSLMNQLDSPIYKPFVDNWILGVQQKLDTATGLIPHEINFETQTVFEGAKGSSQSLMLNFLIEIDSIFAQAQFEKYRAQFLDQRFGLPGVREYPKGAEGNADVDSGPVLLSIGGSASLVGQRTMALYDNIETAIGLRNCIESFGVAYTTDNQKIYVLGLEPIADAFIAWSNVVPIQKAEKQVGNWRWTFQLLSLMVLLPMLGFYKKKGTRFYHFIKNKK
jgi:hypothetical protein